MASSDRHSLKILQQRLYQGAFPGGRIYVRHIFHASESPDIAGLALQVHRCFVSMNQLPADYLVQKTLVGRLVQ